MMKIVGQLKEDILAGEAVLFLGAGVGQAAGLHGGQGLANYLFQKANSPKAYDRHKDDLSKLVAKLDKDEFFTRRWVNKQLTDYFLDSTNYVSLDWHKGLFELRWKAVFTTNYDITLELSEYQTQTKRQRLVPIANPKETETMNGSDTGKLKYYKIHGCARELEVHPAEAPPLVITQRDFQESITRNQPFFEILRSFAYACSMIFVGFQAHRSENNPIMGNIKDASYSLSAALHQQFRPFAVLKDADDDTREDLQEIGVNLIEGTFQEFVDTVRSLRLEQERRLGSAKIDDTVMIRAAGQEIEITRGEYEQYGSQFTTYHEKYIEDGIEQVKRLHPAAVRDLWKGNPSDMFLSTGRYIERTVFAEAASKLRRLVRMVEETNSPRLLVVQGERGSGKTVLAKQLAHFASFHLSQPVLVLTPQASYLDAPLGTGREIDISGWDGRLIDKFLSLFYSDTKDGEVVPVLVADHLAYRQFALDHLIKYLENHRKNCVLLLTLNRDEWMDSANDRFLRLYEHEQVEVATKWDDAEISALFDKIACDEPRITERRDTLIERATSPDECGRDLLFVLYVWFDRQFRRLDEIIAEEVEKLSTDTRLKALFVAIAVFHQYGFSPRVSLCAEGLEIDIHTFSELRSSPIFKTFINVANDGRKGEDYASTRHAEFSRMILRRLKFEQASQVAVMERIFRRASKQDIQLVRDFMNQIYRYGASFTFEEAETLKRATEERLGRDYVLNHQYAAYLIRERAQLEEARFYLDLALKEVEHTPVAAAIIHSLGNLHFALYKQYLDCRDKERAAEHYNASKDYLFRSRTLMANREEHGYYTDIDLMKYRIKHDSDSEEKKSVLRAESFALTLEALKVVPPERQNLLRTVIGESTLFEDLPERDKAGVLQEIDSGRASPILIEYYAEHLLMRPKRKTWKKIVALVDLYKSRIDDPAMATVLCVIAKRAFILNAQTRFERLRRFYDDLVRYGSAGMNFGLLAEYVRLLSVDAFVLNKYDFLQAIAGGVTELFRESHPRFLTEEYILDREYYLFDERDEGTSLHMFVNGSSDFQYSQAARRFSTIINLHAVGQERFVEVEIDPISRYYIRAVRKEIGAHGGRIEANFSVKYTDDGFRATDFRT